MAYLIFIANGEEYDRRRLDRSMVIGRASDCEVSIHDILLSRHHCKLDCLDEADEHWVITDLHSKNGTHLRGRAIERQALHEGDELRIGRTRVIYKSGAYVPGAVVRKKAVVRAADPKEALAGTVTGMVVCEPGESGVYEGLPSPKPRPADPSAYAREDVYGMINQIISSSWDSVMEQNSQPIHMQRAMPVAAATNARRGSIRPKARVSFALQANDDQARSSAVESVSQSSGIFDALPMRRRRWAYAAATIAVTMIMGVTSVTLVLLLGASPQRLPAAIPEAKQAEARGSANADAAIIASQRMLEPGMTNLAGY